MPTSQEPLQLLLPEDDANSSTIDDLKRVLPSGITAAELPRLARTVVHEHPLLAKRIFEVSVVCPGSLIAHARGFPAIAGVIVPHDKEGFAHWTQPPWPDVGPSAVRLNAHQGALLVSHHSSCELGEAVPGPGSLPITTVHERTSHRITSPLTTYGSFRAKSSTTDLFGTRNTRSAPSGGSLNAPAKSNSPRRFA